MNSKSIIGYADNTVRAGVTQDIAANLVVEGLVFTSRKNVSIPAGESNLIFDPTNLDPEKYYVVVLPPSFVAIGGDYVTVELFVGAEYSAGTPSQGVNRDQTVIEKPLSVSIINFGATIDTPGISSGIQWLIPSSATGVGQVADGNASGDLPFIIDPTKIQRLKINNTDAAAQTFEYNLSWAEIPIIRSQG